MPLETFHNSWPYKQSYATNRNKIIGYAENAIDEIDADILARLKRSQWQENVDMASQLSNHFAKNKQTSKKTVQEETRKISVQHTL